MSLCHTACGVQQDVSQLLRLIGSVKQVQMATFVVHKTGMVAVDALSGAGDVKV